MGRDQRANSVDLARRIHEFEHQAGPIRKFQAFREGGCPKCAHTQVLSEWCRGKNPLEDSREQCPFDGQHLHRICHIPTGGCGYHWGEKCADDPTRDVDGTDYSRVEIA